MAGVSKSIVVLVSRGGAPARNHRRGDSALYLKGLGAPGLIAGRHDLGRPVGRALGVIPPPVTRSPVAPAPRRSTGDAGS